MGRMVRQVDEPADRSTCNPDTITISDDRRLPASSYSSSYAAGPNDRQQSCSTGSWDGKAQAFSNLGGQQGGGFPLRAVGPHVLGATAFADLSADGREWPTHPRHARKAPDGLDTAPERAILSGQEQGAVLWQLRRPAVSVMTVWAASPEGASINRSSFLFEEIIDSLCRCTFSHSL